MLTFGVSAIMKLLELASPFLILPNLSNLLQQYFAGANVTFSVPVYELAMLMVCSLMVALMVLLKRPTKDSEKGAPKPPDWVYQ